MMLQTASAFVELAGGLVRTQQKPGRVAFNDRSLHHSNRV
jgi:hypothetical protein